MDIFDDWFNNLMRKSTKSWKRTIVSTGLYDIHTGPSIHYAKVKVGFSPSDVFQIDDDLPIEVRNNLIEQDCYRYIIYGILDILLTTMVYPIKDIKISLIQVDFNEIESSPMAFRLAARDATRKALVEHFPNTFVVLGNVGSKTNL